MTKQELIEWIKNELSVSGGLPIADNLKDL